MEKKQTPTQTKKKTVTKTSKKLYNVSWGIYSRCFNSENERDYFINNYIKSNDVKTWESEVE